MPRRARIVAPGIPWHIIQRGNNRTACFHATEDYCHYLDWLEALSCRHGCQVHAYVLMTNHVHLLLTPEQENSAALLMKHLGQRHAQYVNRTYRRSGTLWEGRYRSCLVQDETYVLACHRYIELNPVRAGMVTDPAAYRWSSYRCNALGRPDSLITPHPQYTGLSIDSCERLAAYCALFRPQLDREILNEIREATSGNFVLGNQRFKREISKMLSRRVTRGRAGRPRKVDDGEVR